MHQPTALIYARNEELSKNGINLQNIRLHGLQRNAIGINHRTLFMFFQAMQTIVLWRQSDDHVLVIYHLHLQGYHLVYATEMRSIQLHDSKSWWPRHEIPSFTLHYIWLIYRHFEKPVTQSWSNKTQSIDFSIRHRWLQTTGDAELQEMQNCNADRQYKPFIPGRRKLYHK